MSRDEIKHGQSIEKISQVCLCDLCEAMRRQWNEKFPTIEVEPYRTKSGEEIYLPKALAA